MSASGIAWIISIAFVLILVGGFFMGFWRGLKRSVVNLIISVVGMIVAFFITPPITNAILNISINVNGTPSTINNVLVDSLKNNEDISLLIKNNPNLDSFFSALPSALANIVVFIVLALVVELLCYIIYKILAVTCLKYKQDEKKLRLFGGGVGLVKTFLFAIFVFMPLSSLVGTLNTVTKDKQYFSVAQAQTSVLADGENDSINETEKIDHLIDSVLPSSVDTIVSGLNNNLLFKICGASNLNNDMFDYLSKVKIDGKDVKVRQEIENGYQVADYVYQLTKYYDYNGLVNFKNTNFEVLEKAVNKLADGELFEKVISTTLQNIIENYKDYSFINNIQGIEKVEPILNDISLSLKSLANNSEIVQYFSSDIKNLFNIFKNLSTNGILDEIKTSNENFIDILLKEGNKNTFTESVKQVFKLNIVKDSVNSIINLALDSVSKDLEKVATDTSNWAEKEWDEISSSLVKIIDDFSELSDVVDIFEVISDPTILVMKDNNIDIEMVTSNLGQLIDEVREFKLLKTAEGKSIIDKLLEKNNISIPSSPLIDQNGEEVNITNYKELFNFVKGALQSIKESGIYSTLTDNNLNNVQKIESVANELTKNSNLLQEIILPLYQIDFTHDIVINNLVETVNKDVMDLSILDSYESWEKELKYISQLLINLNNNKSSTGESYLILALNGDIETIVNSLTEEQVEEVLKPILYSSTTNALKENIANEIEDVVNALTSPRITNIDFTSVTLIEGNNEDQAKEICEVFKSFIDINSIYIEGMKIADIDKNIMAPFMTSLQKNAYRADYGKTQEGIFKELFINLTETIKEEYSDKISASAELTEWFADPDNYIKINFSYVFSLLNK